MSEEAVHLRVVSLAGVTVVSAQARRAATISEVKTMVRDAASIPPSEQRLLSGDSVLSDSDTLERCAPRAAAEALLTLVRVPAPAAPLLSTDASSLALHRPFHWQPRHAEKPFFAVAVEEPSVRWRTRSLFDRGMRTGAFIGTVIPFILVFPTGGLAGSMAFGLVGGSTAVACRSCAQPRRPFEWQWVANDFKDAAGAGFLGVSVVLGAVPVLILGTVCASVGGLLGLAGDAACISVRRLASPFA
mmetsp:Transcript_13824/g.27975  ORF Transcript_13824/g.27975 Transcript_13824/m.27975 type:complete len:245 (-) Transcript_13824:226-960(-)